MDWQARYYPLDLFPTLNANIQALISAGECEAVALVREEINAVGTPDLKTWAAAHAAISLVISRSPSTLSPASRRHARAPR